jgi:hypothetical protein
MKEQTIDALESVKQVAAQAAAMVQSSQAQIKDLTNQVSTLRKGGGGGGGSNKRGRGKDDAKRQEEQRRASEKRAFERGVASHGRANSNGAGGDGAGGNSANGDNADGKGGGGKGGGRGGGRSGRGGGAGKARRDFPPWLSDADVAKCLAAFTSTNYGDAMKEWFESGDQRGNCFQLVGMKAAKCDNPTCKVCIG